VAIKSRERIITVIDFKYIKGQEHAKRAIEVALAGNHSMIMWGQPGIGKSLLIQAATDLMTSLGKGGLQNLAKMDGLQDYIMSGYTKSKADWAGTPVLAASKPCPCGYFGDTLRQCTCTADEIRLFFSSDALDLIKTCSISVELPIIEYEKLSDQRLGEASERIGARILKAWGAQVARTGSQHDDDYYTQRGGQKPLDPELLKTMYDNYPKRYNQQATLADLQAKDGIFALDQAGQALLKAATRQLGFTPRAYFDTLKLGRTIADLGDAAHIQASHLAEAIQYRRKQA
jgi:predicted ATPase with chaperone activity